MGAQSGIYAARWKPFPELNTGQSSQLDSSTPPDARDASEAEAVWLAQTRRDGPSFYLWINRILKHIYLPLPWKSSHNDCAADSWVGSYGAAPPMLCC
jgi:hypothetical protein